MTPPPAASSGPLRRSEALAGHPEITWSVVLGARMEDVPDRSALAGRLEAVWRPGLGAVPSVRAASEAERERVLDAIANERYEDGAPVLRVVLLPTGLLVAGHHSVVDGLGLLALVGALTGEPVESAVRGVVPSDAGPAGLGHLLQRLAGSVFRPPARIVPRDGGPGGGDHLVAAELDGEVTTAGLVAGAAGAVRRWNGPSSRGPLMVAVGASRRPGPGADISEQAAYLRIRLGDADQEDIQSALRRNAPEPSVPRWLPGGRVTAVVGRALAGRTGPSLLVSHLGPVTGPRSLRGIDFFPPAHGRSGLSIGAATIGGRTTVTVRARRSDFSRRAAENFLGLTVDRLLPRGS